MTVNEINLTTLKERIIKWLKADTTIYQQSNPEGNPEENKLKLTEIKFGVPEENDWADGVAPFAAVYNSDRLITDDSFMGSVVNDELTNSHAFAMIEVSFVVDGALAEFAERNIDFLHRAILMRMKSNVQWKDTASDGTLIADTEMCDTSKHVLTEAINAPMLNRRLFGYRTVWSIEYTT